jgi:hypothetical protein
MKDWVGNSSIRNCNIRKENAESNDYYATEPKAVELLLEQEKFSPNIWECACGEGHVANVLLANGYKVYSTDLIDRGYGIGSIDFLKTDQKWKGDIITNPPYKFAKEFVLKALDVIEGGQKVAMFLKLTFLEGKSRRELFKRYPPRTVYVCSGRLQCAKNGVFESTSMVAYAWFVWEKGFEGCPQIKWIN